MVHAINRHFVHLYNWEVDLVNIPFIVNGVVEFSIVDVYFR